MLRLTLRFFDVRSGRKDLTFTEMGLMRGRAGVGDLIRNLIFLLLGWRWQLWQKMEQGSCEGAKLNGSVLDRVLHNTEFTLLSVWKEVQVFLFVKVCKGLPGQWRRLSFSSYLSSTSKSTIFQGEMQASETQRKTGKPFPATENIWCAKA